MMDGFSSPMAPVVRNRLILQVNLSYGKNNSRRIRVSVDMADNYPTATAVVDIVQADWGHWTFEGER